MQATLRRSKKPIQTNNRTKINGDIRPLDISKLVADIPQQIQVFPVRNSYSEMMEMVKNLQSFTKQHFSLRYSRLRFDPHKDTLLSFGSTLVELVFQEGFTLGIQEDETKILYDAPFEPYLYVLETHFLEKLPNKPLKIGFAHLVKHLYNAFPYNVFYDLGNVDFYGHFLESTVDYYKGDEEDEPEAYKEALKSIRIWYNTYRKSSRWIEYYASKDINELLAYHPKKKKYKELKNVLLEGLKLNNEILLRFFSNGYQDSDNVPFDELFGIYYDTESSFESEHIGWINDRANQVGLDLPKAFYSYSSGTCDDHTTDKEIHEFYQLCEILSQLNSQLYNFFS